MPKEAPCVSESCNWMLRLASPLESLCHGTPTTNAAISDLAGWPAGPRFCSVVVFWEQRGAFASLSLCSCLATDWRKALCEEGGRKMLLFRQALCTVTSLQLVVWEELIHLLKLLVRMINDPVFLFFSHFHYQLQVSKNFFDPNIYTVLILRISPEPNL